jgi:hypothetical protein
MTTAPFNAGLPVREAIMFLGCLYLPRVVDRALNSRPVQENNFARRENLGLT